ncbi:uncharacterized protein JCM10292_002597 [Rhodotorula paludigena]|uniref:uncharacterized protein n=1 Tax=Rhodotorula paludigena TaxID=86838 RepID=UPI003175B8B6
MEQLDWGNPPYSLESYLQHSLDARLHWLDYTRADLGKTVQVEWPAERYYGLKLAIEARGRTAKSPPVPDLQIQLPTPIAGT